MEVSNIGEKKNKTLQITKNYSTTSVTVQTFFRVRNQICYTVKLFGLHNTNDLEGMVMEKKIFKAHCLNLPETES